MKRACADVTLKIVDDDDISGFLLWSRESNILSLSEVGSTRPQSSLCYNMKYGVE